jgi:hypothetical protein
VSGTRKSHQRLVVCSPLYGSDDYVQQVFTSYWSWLLPFPGNDLKLAPSEVFPEVTWTESLRFLEGAMNQAV